MIRMVAITWPLAHKGGRMRTPAQPLARYRTLPTWSPPRDPASFAATPTAAMVQTNTRRHVVELAGSNPRHRAVDVPAMATKIMAWSARRQAARALMGWTQRW